MKNPAPQSKNAALALLGLAALNACGGSAATAKSTALSPVERFERENQLKVFEYRVKQNPNEPLAAFPCTVTEKNYTDGSETELMTMDNNAEALAVYGSLIDYPVKPNTRIAIQCDWKPKN